MCIPPSEAPGGYCTQPCPTGVCPPGGVCGIFANQMVCFLDCAHCDRPGYSCEAQGYMGQTGCFPTCELTQTCQGGSPGEEADASSIVNPSGLDAGPFPAPGSDAGVLLPVAAGLQYPTSLTMESGILYVGLNAVAGGILSITPADAGISEVVTASLPANLTSDSAHLYWTATSGDGGVVMQSALDGGAEIVLAAVSYVPASLAIGAQTVYWSAPGAENDGAVLSTPINGGPVTTLASGQAQPVGLLVDGTTLYWANAGISVGYPNSVSGTLPNDEGSVVAWPLPGGPLSTIAGGQGSPVAVAADSQNLYWVNAGQYEEDSLGELSLVPDSGSVVQAAKPGGPPMTLAANQDNPVALSVANGTLYWLNGGTRPAGGALQSIALPGSGDETLLFSLMYPSALLITPSAAYVTDTGTDGLDGALLGLGLRGMGH